MSRNALEKLILSRCLLPVVCVGLVWSASEGARAGDAFSTNNSPAAFRSRARVVVVDDRNATREFRPDAKRVQAMVARGLMSLTGKATAADAWSSLVTTQDVVGIKVFSTPGASSGTRPAVVGAVAEGLIAAGLPPTNIIIWDKHAADLRNAGFFELASRLGVRVAGSAETGYDPAADAYEAVPLGNLVWGDLEFGNTGLGVGRKSFVSKLVSREMTKIINVTPLLNHHEAGVAGNLYSLAMGSVDNTIRFEADANRLATAVPDIYNLPALGDRVVLNIVDALICQYEGGERGLLHYSTVLNQLRFSRDPVALDVLSIRELEKQRRASKAPNVRPNFALYNNAAEYLKLGVSDVKNIQVDTLP